MPDTSYFAGPPIPPNNDDGLTEPQVWDPVTQRWVNGSGTYGPLDSRLDRIFIPAPLMAVTGGVPTLTGQGINSRWPAWFLDDTVATEQLAVGFFPGHWAAYTVTIVWSLTTANAGNVYWSGFVGSVVNGGAAGADDVAIFAGAFAAPATNVVMYTTSAPITVTDDTKLRYLRVARLGANVLDTLVGDVGLVGVILGKV